MLATLCVKHVCMDARTLEQFTACYLGHLLVCLSVRVLVVLISTRRPVLFTGLVGFPEVCKCLSLFSLPV